MRPSGPPPRGSFVPQRSRGMRAHGCHGGSSVSQNSTGEEPMTRCPAPSAHPCCGKGKGPAVVWASSPVCAHHPLTHRPRVDRPVVNPASPDDRLSVWVAVAGTVRVWTASSTTGPIPEMVMPTPEGSGETPFRPKHSSPFRRPFLLDAHFFPQTF